MLKEAEAKEYRNNIEGSGVPCEKLMQVLWTKFFPLWWFLIALWKLTDFEVSFFSTAELKKKNTKSKRPTIKALFGILTYPISLFRNASNSVDSSRVFVLVLIWFRMKYYNYLCQTQQFYTWGLKSYAGSILRESVVFLHVILVYVISSSFEESIYHTSLLFNSWFW